jgi:tetratricopeptide (TPR) repeat protein
MRRQQLVFLVAGLAVASAGGSARGAQGGRVELNAAQRRKLEMVVLRSHLKLGERATDAHKTAVHLTKAERCHDWFKRRTQMRPEEGERRALEEYRMASATMLVRAFGRAAAKARAAKLPAAADEFVKSRKRYLVIVRDSPRNRDSLDGRLWLAEEFAFQGEFAEALVDYTHLLTRFDPDGDGARVPDADLVTLADLVAAQKRTRGLRLRDYPRMRLALAEIALCLRGTLPKKARRAERDYSRGAKLVDAFFVKYPTYDLGRRGAQGPARRGLRAIKAEMEFRRKVFRARSGLASASLELARERSGKDRKAAAELYHQALGAARTALSYRPRDVDLLLCRAEGLLGTGRAGAARDCYRQLRSGSRDGGDIWWSATRGLFRALEANGDLRGARTVIVLAISGYPKSVAKKWPGARREAARLAGKMGMSYAKFMGTE